MVKVIPEMCVDSSQLSTKISDVLSQLLLAGRHCLCGVRYLCTYVCLWIA